MPMHAFSDAARAVRRMLAELAEPSGEDLWRFGVLQFLDDYESIRHHHGVPSAAAVLAGEPGVTGHSGVDAAFAALACGLADRDGWTAPSWALSDERAARLWWFVSDSACGRAWAMVQAPGQFRIRGVFIADTALQRA